MKLKIIIISTIAVMLSILFYFKVKKYNDKKKQNNPLDNMTFVPATPSPLPFSMSDTAHKRIAKDLLSVMGDWGTLNSDVDGLLYDLYDSDFIAVYNYFGSPSYDGIGGSLPFVGVPMDLTGWMKKELEPERWYYYKDFFSGTNLF